MKISIQRIPYTIIHEERHSGGREATTQPLFQVNSMITLHYQIKSKSLPSNAINNAAPVLDPKKVHLQLRPRLDN